MFQKIANILSIVSFVLVSSVIGGGYFSYKFITSPKGQEKIKKQILDELKGGMPKLINKELPKFTQPALPTKPEKIISF